MATMRKQVWINRSASDVWAVVGDPSAVTSWFPNMASVTVEGDQRTITLSSGMTLVERIHVRDDLRRFQYCLEGPLPIEEHRASIDVIPGADEGRGSEQAAETTPHCLVIYSTDVVPHALAPVLDGAVAEALVSLKQLMEGA